MIVVVTPPTDHHNPRKNDKGCSEKEEEEGVSEKKMARADDGDDDDESGKVSAESATSAARNSLSDNLGRLGLQDELGGGRRPAGNVVDRIINSYDMNFEISLNYGLILRELAKHAVICRFMLRKEVLYSLFRIARENSEEKSDGKNRRARWQIIEQLQLTCGIRIEL